MSVTMEDLLDTFLEDEHLPYARIMLYGAEGSRKTVTACSAGAPDMKTILLESDPEGYVSLYNHPDIYYMPDGKTKRILRFEYQGLSQIDAFAEFISDEKFDDCDTIVIDTTSGVVNSDLDTITHERFLKGKLTPPEMEVPDWPCYRTNQDRVRRAFTPLMKVKKHVIMTSHARQEKDSRGVLKYTPDMPQAVRNHLTRLCHLVGYMTAEAIESVDESAAQYLWNMQVHPTRLITAKSRIGGLPVVINEPDLRQIIADWVANGAKLAEEETEFAPESQGLESSGQNIDPESSSPDLEI